MAEEALPSPHQRPIDITANDPRIDREVLSNMHAELIKAYPGAALNLIISDPNTPLSPDAALAFIGEKDENGQELPIYYASTIKPVIAATAAALATAAGETPDTAMVPFTLTEEVMTELVADLDTRVKKVPPHDFAFLLPMIEAHLSPGEYQNVTTILAKVKAGEAGLADLQPALVSITEVKLTEAIAAALGPSSNEAVKMIYAGIKARVPGKEGPDVVQEKVDELLGPDNLLTMNNSEKEATVTKIWNAGRASELARVFFGAVLSRDPRLNISDDFVNAIIEPMATQHADPVLELRERAKEANMLQGATIIGKSGYFPYLDVGAGDMEMLPFMQAHGWKPEDKPKVVSMVDFQRATRNGKTVDVAWSILIPTDIDTSDEAALEQQKVAATNIIYQHLLPTIEGLV